MNNSQLHIDLPVKIKFEVLQKILKKKLVGEYLEKDENTKYAQIIDISLAESEADEYQLDLYLGLNTLTTFYKNKTLALLVHLSIDFNEETQEVWVKDFKVKSNSGSWLVNKFLQLISNSVLHHSIISKMKVDLQPKIEKRLGSINEKFQNEIELKSGVFFNGKLNELKLEKISIEDNRLVVWLNVKGKGEIHIKEFPL